MSERYRFIDSDAHVLEPVDMFEKYLDPKFRDQMPYARTDYQGEPLAFGFELRIPAPNGSTYVMPFGNDPLTGVNTIDQHYPIDYFKRQCYISADPDDPGIKQVIDVLGDDNVVTATDFSHPEGRRYVVAVKELLELPGVSLESKKKIMWDNALKLYPIQAA
jgi:hypothetical protein